MTRSLSAATPFEYVAATSYQRFTWRTLSGDWSNNNVYLLLRVRGRVDPDLIATAIDTLFTRHEALRTTLVYRAGTLQQHVRRFAPPAIGYTRLRGVDSLDDPEADATIASSVTAPFDFRTGEPLCRVHCFSAAPGDQVIALVLHHAIADLASVALLFEELVACLADAPTGAPAPAATTQLRDFARWERTSELNAQFWRRRIAPTGSTMPLGWDSSRACPAVLIGYETPVIDADVVERLEALAVAHGATLATVVVATVAAAFSSWTTEALRIGVVSANRFQPAFRGVVGPLFSILPIRVPVARSLSFVDVIVETRREWFSALTQNVSMHALTELAGTDNWLSPSLYDVSVNFVPYVPVPPAFRHRPGVGSFEIAGHSLEADARVRQPPHVMEGFPCIVIASTVASGGLQFGYRTDPMVVDRAAAAELGQYLTDVLRTLLDTPHAPIGTVIDRHGPLSTWRRWPEASV